MRITRVIIIGAGIVGVSIARVLSKYENLKVHLVDMEPDAGWGVSRANTAIIHGGYDDDPRKYPLRARLCVRGAKLWRRWSRELDIPVNFSGILVLAFTDSEINELHVLKERGVRNGVPGIRVMLDKDVIQALEPNVSDDVKAALWAPTGGVINPIEAVIALVENAVDNGVITHFNTKVLSVKVSNGEVVGVETSHGLIEADIVINAAGLYADEISRSVGVEDFTIKPRRGEYYVFDESAEPKVTRVLFPTPTPKTKGVAVAKTTEGNLMIGPTAEDLSLDEKEKWGTTERGLKLVWNEARKLVKALPPLSKVIKVFAGLRPEPPHGDFIIRSYKYPHGFINVAGTRSPGLTSAPAIAYEVVRLIKSDIGVKLVEKSKWNPFRCGINKFRKLDSERRAKLVQEDPNYGVVVCKHRLVTKAEIVEAIKRIRKIGAEVTVRGVKYRTWAGMGECQGAFCLPLIVKLIADLEGIDLWKVKLTREGSEIGIGDIYELVRR